MIQFRYAAFAAILLSSCGQSPNALRLQQTDSPGADSLQQVPQADPVPEGSQAVVPQASGDATAGGSDQVPAPSPAPTSTPAAPTSPISTMDMTGAAANDCSGNWELLTDTDPANPKLIQGDSNAAYGSFSYWADPSVRYVIKGKYPHSRFFSIETAQTRWGFKSGTLIDHEIEPDAGSVNPFREGVDIAAPNRSYTIHVAQEGAMPPGPNVMLLPRSSLLQQSFLLRIYSPNVGGVKPADFPRVFAVDAKTGAPTKCLPNAPIMMSTDLPQILTLPILRKPQFEFGTIEVPFGPNSAIPDYLAGTTRTRDDDVVVVKFKAPTFIDTRVDSGPFTSSKQVRYWSICSANAVKIITLNCLPDWMAKVDGDGFVRMVYGKGADVAASASARGHNFLNDTRDASQPVAQLIYRNILPVRSFLESDLYKGDFAPRGVTCSKAEYIANGCGI